MFDGMPDSKTPQILGGFIRLMTDAGIGVWDEDGDYTDDRDPPGIYPGDIPHTMNQGLGVHPYPVSMDTKPGVDVMGIQVLIRTKGANSLKAIAVADQLEATFHGLEHQTLGGWHSPLIWRNSLAVLGLNDNNNYQITDNYYMYIDVYRKAAQNG